MPKAKANGLELEYESFGDPSNPTVLLVMGLGMQLTSWPDPLVEDLVGRGYHVVRYDNRDIGLSTGFDHMAIPNLRKVVLLNLLGFKPRVPYRLEDMADDAVGLMDALAIEKVHLVGVSMGGMISQLVAGHYPERVLSLTSIMSTTGNRRLPRATQQAIDALMTPRPDPSNGQAVVDREVNILNVFQGSVHTNDPARLRALAERNYQRSYRPLGATRHLVAAAAAKDRRKLLNTVKAPAMVIHGEEDPLIRVECGVDTAKHLPNAELRVIEGMGHGMPLTVLPIIAEGIDAVINRT